MPTVHIIVQGKVQGVFYRATARQIAQDLSITGWIKNTKAGDVEIVASGNNEQIQQYIDWCKQGPPKAHVTNITVTPEPEITFEQFSVIG